MLRAEARRADEISRPLVDDAGRSRQLDGLDVAEAPVVSQHLHVQQPNEEFLGLLLVGGQNVLRPRTAGRTGLFGPLELLLEDGHLPGDDPILLLLGLGFADRLEELEELLGQVHSAHGWVFFYWDGQRIELDLLDWPMAMRCADLRLDHLVIESQASLPMTQQGRISEQDLFPFRCNGTPGWAYPVIVLDKRQRKKK